MFQRLVFKGLGETDEEVMGDEAAEDREGEWDEHGIWMFKVFSLLLLLLTLLLLLACLEGGEWAESLEWFEDCSRKF